MPSPWKRVDLFSLSSITSAAAVRRRPTPTKSTLLPSAATASQAATCLALRHERESFDSTAEDTTAARCDNNQLASAFASAPGVASSSSSTAQIATGPTATRVSIARLLCNTALTWQGALTCFTALAEREAMGSGGEAKHDRRTVRGNSASAVESPHRCLTIPLEAIVAVYSTLLRRHLSVEVTHPDYGRERSLDEEALLTAETTTWRNASAALGASLLCTVDSAGAPSLSSGGRPLPLRFLAYAAQHNTALAPIHCFLAASLAVQSELLTECAVRSASSLHQQSPTTRCSRAEQLDELLLRLLSPAAVLHVGLSELLRGSQRTRPTPSSPSTQHDDQQQQRQRWAALRAIHHLQCYGGAQEVLTAFAASTGVKPTDAAGESVETSSATTFVPEQCGAQPPTGSAHEKVRLAFDTIHKAGSSRPAFTELLHILQEAWRADNAGRVASTGDQQSTTNADTVPSFCQHTDRVSLGHGGRGQSSAGTSESAASLLKPRQKNAMEGAEVQCAPRSLSAKMTTAFELQSVDSSVEAAEALAVVRSLAPSLSCSAADSAHEPSSCGERLTNAELADITLNVATFVWRARFIEARGATQSGDGCSTLQGNGGSVKREATCAAETELDEFLHLVRAATRFVAFDVLQSWLDRLLSLPTCAASPSLPPSSSTSSLDGMAPQQWEALMCLLTRAVRRAPSWEAVCAVLAVAWSRMPSNSLLTSSFAAAGSASSAGAKDHQWNVSCESGAGVAASAPLLRAFFASQHHPRGGEELRFWCSVLCTPHCSDSMAWNGHASSTASCVHLGAFEQTILETMSLPLPLHREQQRMVLWSQLLFGRFDPRAPAQSLECRHSARALAVMQLVEQWLRPAHALDFALDCLAAAHAHCALEWSQALSVASSDSRADPPPCSTQYRKGKPAQAAQRGSPASAHAEVLRAAATAQLAEQHRAFCGALLTEEERRSWLETVLCYTASGSARQLVLEASMQARWSTGNADAASKEQREALTILPQLNAAALVADVEWVLQRWLDLNDRAGAAQKQRLTLIPFQWSHKVCGGSIEDVGPLLHDVLSAVTQPTHASTSDSVSSLLLAAARRSITAAGLQLEHLVDVPCEGGFAALSTPSGRLESEGLPSSLHVIHSRRTRLDGWLSLVCTSPAALLADEQCAVVWLCILMRQVEELHRCWTATKRDGGEPSTEDSASQTSSETIERILTAREPCAGVFQQIAGDDGSPEWTAELEEAVVRRAALSLSSKLWTALPSSSLLPPMLLNWMLTRGGARTWGDAVRWLRSAAETSPPAVNGTQTSRDSSEPAATAAEEQRRFWLLVLPLDRVMSVEHAIRVLRTLQLVEERCEISSAALAATTTAADRGRVESRRSANSGVPKWRSSSPAPCGLVQLCGAPLQSCPSSTAAPDTADSVVLSCYYRQIERVLLREWYCRAVAAVLLFLVEHPEHTFLTRAVDAPQHLARILRHQPANLAVTGSELDTRGKWSQPYLGKGASPEKESVARDEVTETRTGDAFVDLHNAVAQWSGEVTETADACRQNGVREASAVPSALPPSSTVDEAACTAASPPSLSHTSRHSSNPLRVPLHLIGTFILQERWIGSELGEEGAAQNGEYHTVDAALSLLRCRGKDITKASPSQRSAGPDVRRGTRRRSLLSAHTPSLVFSAPNELLRGATDNLANPASLRGQCVRSVHPELLQLFRRVLAVKKEEEEGGNTVEDALGEVLAHRCTVDVSEFGET